MAEHARRDAMRMRDHSGWRADVVAGAAGGLQQLAGAAELWSDDSRGIQSGRKRWRPRAAMMNRCVRRTVHARE
jgi:hypothetical protein